MGKRKVGHSEDQSPCPGTASAAISLTLEVGTVITVRTVDAALQNTCAIFREQADRGNITPAERDLLIDGAILLAMHVDDQARDGRVGSDPGWPEGPLPEPVGRHERRPAAVAA
jgi:hypothetical protein